jgi:hypothetical protein
MEFLHFADSGTVRAHQHAVKMGRDRAQRLVPDGAHASHPSRVASG